MARTLGVDHGTRGIRFCLLDGQDKRFFEIDRWREGRATISDLLEKDGFFDADLIGLTYSMADSISRITDIKKVKNRGQTEPVTGEFIGVGTKLYDEIADSQKRAVLIPGLHRGIACLDERFKLLYSHMAASEKVALAYHAFNRVNEESDVKSIIVSDISSNTVTIAIKSGRFFAAIDACLGASGLLHGPLDLGDIRRVDSGGITANKAFYSAGVSQKVGIDSDDVLNGNSIGRQVARNALVMASVIEVCGLAGIIKPQAVAIAGSAGVHENVFGKLKSELEVIAPVFKLHPYAAAIGAAEIARDILLGQKDFLGIGVDI
jgi:putative methanogenesis marker protein 12